MNILSTILYAIFEIFITGLSKEIAENSLNQPPMSPNLGGLFMEMGDSPRPPAGSILHLSFSGLFS